MKRILMLLGSALAGLALVLSGLTASVNTKADGKPVVTVGQQEASAANVRQDVKNSGTRTLSFRESSLAPYGKYTVYAGGTAVLFYEKRQVWILTNCQMVMDGRYFAGSFSAPGYWKTIPWSPTRRSLRAVC